MKTFIRWIAPLLLGIVMFNCIRLVTDLPRNDEFWSNSLRYHMQALCVTILSCYYFDYRIRKFLSKDNSRIKQSTIKEYLLLTFIVFVSLNLMMITGDLTGLLYMGNHLNDYVIANVIYLPLFLLYYTLVRSYLITTNYHKQSLQLEKVKVEQLDMELKFLKSQYHPHFLFNALNTIYFQIEDENSQARSSIELLSQLLRYQLYDIQKKVTLRQEIDYLTAYIRFQQMRMSQRLQLTQEYDENMGEQEIHPLLFQPLVENAFKYVGGDYNIYFSFKLNEDRLLFKAENSIPANSAEQKQKDKGIGIENLKRRLNLLYPEKHQLTITHDKEMFRAELTLKLDSYAD
ncbi:sensor histidine kinase [Bacteroides ihuae]|uniref:sensor histidine kinase n=1 Tax=Bacteroides ihuae TaxID=1852362 RepID=UPI0008D95E02|nr:histidine kinase [Bacteroides ihuae]